MQVWVVLELAAPRMEARHAPDLGPEMLPPVQVVPLLCNKFKLDVSFPKPLFIFLVLF
jgi:hypothetical protein